MGGRPLFALNIVGFPTNRLPLEVLQRILNGAHDVAREAGVSIIGGHSVDDTEPKYGLAVSGTIDPQRILTNATAQPGDAIVLTKPIGTGILATAMKRGLVEEPTIRRAVSVMRTLNRAAAETMAEFPVSACTDVTGFGLLGHLKEMAGASGVDAELNAGSVPVLDGVRELAAANVVPGGSADNLAFVADVVNWPDAMTRAERIVLCDAQTSGGLLITLPSGEVSGFLDALRRRGVEEAAQIGAVTAHGEGRITVHAA
jgi:selenide,water dikinase